MIRARPFSWHLAARAALLLACGCRDVLGLDSARLRSDDAVGPVGCAHGACADASIDASTAAPAAQPDASGASGEPGASSSAGRMSPGTQGSAGTGGQSGASAGDAAGGNDSGEPSPECAGLEPDALVCVGTEVHRCGPDLVTVSALPCSGDLPACAVGHCVECNAPEPALLCADASTPRTCSSTNRWVNQAACSGPTPNCLDGTCVELCASGEKRCSNNIPQSCESQSWRNELTCSGDQPICDQGACIECKDPAPELLCNGASPRTCVDGKWQGSLACSGMNSTQTCTSGQCKVVTCSLDWGDCNGLPGDGCEHAVSADAQNCGTCRNACGSGLCASNRCLVSHNYGFSTGTTDDAIGAGMLFGIPVHIAGDGILTGLAAIITPKHDDARIYIGLYDSTASGEPRRLVQSTPMLTLEVGVNESSVTQTPIGSGDYWILWITDGIGHFATNGGTINLRASSSSFGSLPTQINGTLGTVAAPPPDLYAIVAQ